MLMGVKNKVRRLENNAMEPLFLILGFCLYCLGKHFFFLTVILRTISFG